MHRHECLAAIANEVGDALAVTSAGGETGDWETLRPHPGNLRSRTLGLVSSLGLGVALGLPQRKVLVIDGDGSLLMNLCGLPTIAALRPRNLVHIVFDNGMYESSGGSRTHSRTADLVAIARAAGYPHAVWTESVEDFRQEVLAALARDDLSFVGARVESGGSPPSALTEDEPELKYRFIRYIEQTEGRSIMGINYPPA